jgi:predicted GNAT family acetyltransferase
MSATVRDNTESHRFELEIDDHVAKAWYRRQGNVITFTHTEVPPELEGKGVGSRLARGALDAVRAAGEKVVALCPFIAAYMRRHREYDDLLKTPRHDDPPAHPKA